MLQEIHISINFIYNLLLNVFGNKVLNLQMDRALFLKIFIKLKLQYSIFLLS